MCVCAQNIKVKFININKKNHIYLKEFVKNHSTLNRVQFLGVMKYFTVN